MVHLTYKEKQEAKARARRDATVMLACVTVLMGAVLVLFYCAVNGIIVHI